LTALHPGRPAARDGHFFHGESTMTRLDAVPVTGAPRATRARDSPSRFGLCALWLALSVPVSAPAQGQGNTAGRAVRPDQHSQRNPP
jgi:hypothetical protein